MSIVLKSGDGYDVKASFLPCIKGNGESVMAAQIPTRAYKGVMNVTRIDQILFAMSVVTANLPLGITYAMLLAR